jgi:hypothetical protein
MKFSVIAVQFIILTAPTGQPIEVNPKAIVAMREPRGAEHFHKSAHCLLSTSDGKWVTVAESCAEVHKILELAK